MGEIILDLNRIQLFEAGAQVLAAIAYPEPGKVAKREREYLALCRQTLRVAHAVGQGGLGLIDPKYAFGAPDRATMGTKGFERRCRQRLFVGSLAEPLIRRAGGIDVHPSFPSTINATIDAGMGKVGVADNATFRRRWWVPSLPVIHLGAAFFQIEMLFMGNRVCDGENENNHATTLAHLMTNEERLTMLLRLAQAYEPLVIEWAPGGFDPEAQLRFRIGRQEAIQNSSLP